MLHNGDIWVVATNHNPCVIVDVWYMGGEGERGISCTQKKKHPPKPMCLSFKRKPPSNYQNPFFFILQAQEKT